MSGDKGFRVECECDSGSGKAWNGKSWWNKLPVGAKAGLIIGAVILGLGAVVGLFSLFGHIVMWLWNWIMPYLFQLPTIDFWMAWGIVLLSMILFGRASGSSGGDGGRNRRRKKTIRATMENMADDQGRPEADNGQTT